MAVRIITEDGHRRHYPDGRVMGNWGDVFVVLVILSLTAGIVSVPIVALYRHFQDKPVTVRLIENE